MNSREAEAPREVRQADHPQLDIRVLDFAGKPGRPWLLTEQDMAVLGESRRRSSA